MQAEAEDKVDD